MAIQITSSATEVNTCAYGELSVSETVALRQILEKVIANKDYSFIRRELMGALPKLKAIEAKADADERYIGFTIGTKRLSHEEAFPYNNGDGD